MTNQRTYRKTSSRMAVGIAAAAFAISLFGGAANAALNPSDPDYDWHNRFDLGIDVSGVVPTREGVRSFLAALAPETRRIIMATCEHYMERPSGPVGLTSSDTKPFCRIAVDL